MYEEFFSGGFRSTPVLAVITATAVQDVVAQCNEVYDAGVKLLEVPMRGPAPLDLLRAAASVGRERGLPVGAGTVYTRSALDLVFQNGASYAVAPGIDPKLAAFAQRNGMPYLPGVATPTDVQQALESGCTWLKAFPASALGREWVAAVNAVFPQVRFVATGGVRAETAQDFLNAGAAALGVGAAWMEVVKTLKGQTGA